MYFLWSFYIFLKTGRVNRNCKNVTDIYYQIIMFFFANSLDQARSTGIFHIDDLFSRYYTIYERTIVSYVYFSCILFYNSKITKSNWYSLSGQILKRTINEQVFEGSNLLYVYIVHITTSDQNDEIENYKFNY